jgi:hypothetical protein
MKLRMEDTIRDHAPPEMVELLLGIDGGVKVPVRYNGWSRAADKLDYPMYNLLAGEKTAAKREIINKLLTLASLTWVITGGIDPGSGTASPGSPPYPYPVIH